MKSLKEFLRPEFLGRVDEIVVFRPLSEEDYQRIAALMLDELKGPLSERGVQLRYDDALLREVAHRAFGEMCIRDRLYLKEVYYDLPDPEN